MPSLSLTPNTPGNLLLTAPYPLSAINLYNVTDYGAKGDGVTDDTATIQAAINAAASVRGKVVFPAKTHLVTSLTVPSYVTLEGVGFGPLGTTGTIIKQAAGTATPVIQTAATTGQQSILIRNLIVDISANTGSNTGGILFQGTKNSRIEGCTVNQPNTYGIKILGGSGGLNSGDAMYCSVVGNTITNIPASCVGVHVAQAAGNGAMPEGCMIYDNFISSSFNSSQAFKFEGTGVNVFTTCAVLMNRTIGPGTPWTIDCNYTTIAFNRFETSGNLVTSTSSRSNNALLMGNSYSCMGAGSYTLTDSGTGTTQIQETNPAGLVSIGAPGSEIAYAEFTADVTVSGTSGAQTSIVSAPAKTYDTRPIVVEFFSAQVATAAASGAFVVLSLWDGATELGPLANVTTPAAASASSPVRLARRLTPSVGSHTYQVKAWQGGGNGTVKGNIGTGGNTVPGFIRISYA